MQHTVIINHRSYNLPKKTIAVTERMDEVAKADTIKGLSTRDKYNAVYGLVKDLLGEENAKEVFGTDNLEEMDMCEITLVFRMIVDVYNKPVADYVAKQTLEKIKALPLDKMSSVVSMAEAVANSRKNND